MKRIGTWWSDSSIELVEIDGRIYALSGWNGEKYLHCWRCIDRFTEDGTAEYELTPVYAEIEDEFEIVDYTVF